MKRPRGILTGSFEQLHDAGCIQTLCDRHEGRSAQQLDAKTRSEAEMLFYGLMAATQRNPCDGCPVFKDGACKVYKQYHTEVILAQRASERDKRNATTPPGTEQFPGLSVAQIAEKLGISKAEVRRRKMAGTI